MVVVSIDIIYYLRRKKKNGIAGAYFIRYFKVKFLPSLCMVFNNSFCIMLKNHYLIIFIAIHHDFALFKKM